MNYFDYEGVAREAGVPDELLKTWRDGFALEYPGDDMMIELRLLRACNAAQGGADRLASVAQALEEEFSGELASNG
jgi:hypothetical protein